MSGIVGSYFNTRGSGVVAKLGTDGQIFTSTGAGLSQGFEDAAGGGLTVADTWRLTTAVEVDGTALLSANLEQADTYGFANLGSAMTESSGIFTFPSTGYYLIKFHAVNYQGDSYTGNNNVRYCHNYIYTTTDNSSYNRAADGSTFLNDMGPIAYASSDAHFVFDVTNTTNCKVSFYINNYSNAIVDGDTNVNVTYMSFIKLGDT